MNHILGYKIYESTKEDIKKYQEILSDNFIEFEDDKDYKIEYHSIVRGNNIEFDIKISYSGSDKNKVIGEQKLKSVLKKLGSDFRIKTWKYENGGNNDTSKRTSVIKFKVVTSDEIESENYLIVTKLTKIFEDLGFIKAALKKKLLLKKWTKESLRWPHKEPDTRGSMGKEPGKILIPAGKTIFEIKELLEKEFEIKWSRMYVNNLEMHPVMKTVSSINLGSGNFVYGFEGILNKYPIRIYYPDSTSHKLHVQYELPYNFVLK